MVQSKSLNVSSCIVPVVSSSKHWKAFFITSSGSVPFSFSPNMVRNIVKLMGPEASFTIASRLASVGSWPETRYMISIVGLQSEDHVRNCIILL